MKRRRYFKNIVKRQLYEKTELSQRLNKIFEISFTDTTFKGLLKEIEYKLFLSSSFKSKIKNLCVISGRSKGIHKKFKISRIVLKELSGKGCFFGLKKASW